MLKLKKYIVVFLVIFFYLNTVQFDLVFAYSKSDLQQKLINTVYGGVGGRVSCDFDGYTTTSGRHEGIDLAFYQGANIYAVIDGVVSAARTSSSGLTTLAIYSQKYNLTVIYLHTQNFAVSKGDIVSKGQLITHEGRGGTSSAHTHIEIRLGYQEYASKSVGDSVLDNPDPYPYLEKILNYEYVNLGDGFMANIIQRSAWATVINNNGNVEIGNGVGNAKELWWFARQDDGSYKIESMYDNRYLDVMNAETADGTNIQVCVDTGSDAQKWFIIDSEHGYVLVPKNAQNSCLDCAGGATGVGTNIQLYTRNNTAAQGFSIYKQGSEKFQNLGDEFLSYIINTKSWLHLTRDDDENVRAYSVAGNANQKWHFVRQADGSYTIKNIWDGKYLDVDNAGNSNGTNVKVYDYNGSGAQKWYIYGESGDYRLKAQCTDCVLDIQDGNFNEGANVQMWQFNNSVAQKFQIWKLDEDIPAKLEGVTTGAIRNTVSGKLLTVDDDGYVKLGTQNGSANQLWQFIRCADGGYKIRSAYNGGMLDVETGGDANELKLHIWDDDTNENNQRFFFYDQGKGYVIRPKSSSSRVLDCDNGGKINGTQIQIYDRNNTTAQIFDIYQSDDVQLSASVLDVTVDKDNSSAVFDWNDVNAATRYDVKIWKNKVFEGDAHYIEWGAEKLFSIELEPGDYEAYVDACNAVDVEMSNVVKFTIPEKPVEPKKAIKLSLNKESTSKQIIVDAFYDCTDIGIDEVKIVFNAPIDIVDNIYVEDHLNMDNLCYYSQIMQVFHYSAVSENGTVSNSDHMIAKFIIDLKQPLKKPWIFELQGGTYISSPSFEKDLNISTGTLEKSSITIDPVIPEETPPPDTATDTPSEETPPPGPATDAPSAEPTYPSEEDDSNEDHPYEIDHIKAENNTATLRVSGSSKYSGVLVFAVYDDQGKLAGIIMDENFTENEMITYNINSMEAAYVSAFVWDDIVNMRPLSSKKSVDVEYRRVTSGIDIKYNAAKSTGTKKVIDVYYRGAKGVSAAQLKLIFPENTVTAAEYTSPYQVMSCMMNNKDVSEGYLIWLCYGSLDDAYEFKDSYLCSITLTVPEGTGGFTSAIDETEYTGIWNEYGYKIVNDIYPSVYIPAAGE